ncbi:MAG: hypothetical protein D3917_07045 [Candidatus Electrothrix sp. AX5]|nr:hypothetical protein [Candidatus Electrothrix sp. AX5]
MASEGVPGYARHNREEIQGGHIGPPLQIVVIPALGRGTACRALTVITQDVPECHCDKKHAEY